jgi:hypothetical protein
MSTNPTAWDAAVFQDLAEMTAAELGLEPEPAWDSGWHSGAHLLAGNGTGWSLSYPGGYGEKGMTRITPIWPGGHAPPGSGGIRAGITATRGPQIVAARIRLLAPAYRAALTQLAASQAQDAAEQARRDEVAAQIVALIPDDSPEPDPRYPRVSVSAGTRSTEVHIAGAGTARFYRDAAEIDLERFRAPANVVLAMLAAYAQTPREPAPLEVGPPADYTHELAGPLRDRATPARARSAVTVRDTPRRAAAAAQPELITGALRLLEALEKPAGNTSENMPGGE